VRLTWNPPYDSPLEDEFILNLEKYAGDLDSFEPQVAVSTICGRFILDFVARVGARMVAFECDGKAYHDAFRDEWRDAMILGAEAVDTVYRLRGSDLYYHMPDCLFVLSKLEPWLFSDRGLANLERLASKEARAFDYSDDPSVLLISYAGSSPEPQYILVERRSVMNREGTRQYWRSVFEYAQTEGGGDLDAMIARRKASWGAS
jgi:hypothetical protein